MIERPSRRLPVGAAWIGTNYWSRSGGPDMWGDAFDPAVIASELDVLRRHGLRVTRSFLLTPFFLPAPRVLEPEALKRFSAFLDLHADLEMTTVPTFIVGHMSGENRDLPWRAGRDLYRDGAMLAEQAWFVREIGAAFAGHPAVVGWLLSNEMPLYGGETAPEYGRAWVEVLVDALRATGATQPVSTGDGAWGLEVTGHDNGFRLRDLAPAVDFVGPHSYPQERDEWRQLLTPAFVCELAAVAGRPVVLEEFGVTSAFAADDAAADYYRQVLATTLLAGASGWLAWNNTDFDLPDADPYRHHAFELRFGLTDAAGTPKPALTELADFSALLDRLDVEHLSRPPSRTALLVPSYLEVDYPITDPAVRPVVRDVLLQSFVATRAADLGAALVREADGIPVGQAGLVLAPSVHQLTAPGWRALRASAEAGAVVYVSYFAGTTGFHRGLWHPDLNGFFGVRHRLRYGLVDAIDEDELAWTMVRAHGDLAAGDVLRFAVGGNEHARTRLPVEPKEAEVLAEDAQGRPALMEHRVGDGAIVLAVAPIEYLASTRAAVNPDDSARLYRALAVAAGTLPPLTVDRPDVHVDRLAHADGRSFAIFVSYADEPLTVTPRLTTGTLHDLATGESLTTLPLSTRGVTTVELR